MVVKRTKSLWLLPILIIIGALAAITGIGLIVGDEGSRSSSGNTAASQLEFKPIGQFDFSVVIPPTIEPNGLNAAARVQCAGKTLCGVYGWLDSSAVATALPMTNRERAALSYQYMLNRNSGLDRALIDCRAFKGLPKDRCLDPLTEKELERASE